MAKKSNSKEGKINVGIDLGTSNLRIYVEGRGMVYNEPSLIAIDKATGNVVSVGNDAAALLDKTHDKVEVKKPIHGGVISDIDLVRQIIVYTVKKLLVSGFGNISRLMLCMTTEITETEKTALETLGNELGVQDTRIEEEIKASSIGGDINIYKPMGHLVIDIGGGTTDFGVISLGDVVLSRSIKTAGDYFDSQITHYVKEKYNLEIGPQTAEQLKIHLASLTGDIPINEEGNVCFFETRGRDLVSGLPRMVVINAEEIREIMLECFEPIRSALISTLESTPPELSGDLVDTGVLVTGGGALIKGVKEYFEDIATVRVVLAKDPINSVIEGTKQLLKISKRRYFGDYR